ncbi:MAG: flagellin FliC [Magnetococcales bacterium]|nr:flagellin FliC [Magnetococcales bacterium]
MALYINTNVASINAQRQLTKSTGALTQTFQRLSSGYRINSAKDDAAGLAISQRMTAQVRGLNQAIRNANDGISVVQVAEGALDETTNAMQRIRELAVQASNDTYNLTDRSSLQKEVDQLLSEIQRIASTTHFNNQNLLDGTYTSKYFQIGMFAGQRLRVSIGAATTTNLLGNMTTASMSTLITNVSNAQGALAKIDTALNSVADLRANLGAVQNRFESIVANLANVVESTSASRARITDADIAYETANLTRNTILQQAGTAVLAQANQQPQIALQLLGGAR